MPFGLTPSDILEAYPGTLFEDYAAGNECGEVVIQREIERQHSILTSKFGPYLRGMLRYARGIQVEVDPDTGFIELPFPALNPEDVWAISTASLCTPCREPSWSELPRTPIIISFDEDGNPVYTLEGPPYPSSVALVYEYSPDLDMPSLALLLRDFVACALGRRLYADTGDQEWSLVRYYCDSAKETLEMITNNPRWLPSELAGLDLAWRPAAINAYRLERSD